MRENFLSPQNVETKLRDTEIAGRVGKWLSEREHAERVAEEAGAVLRVGVELLDDDDIQHVIDRMIVRRIAEPQWGPPVGRVLSTLLAENRQALIQLLCDRAFQWSLNAGDTIERVITRDSPSWSPRFVDQLVGDRIHRELMDFTDKVRRDPNHELRQSANRFLFEFADDLQNDPPTIAKAESVKEQLMARDEVTRAAETASRGIAARRRRVARQGGQLDRSRGAASGGFLRRRDHLDHHRDHRAMGCRGRQQTNRIARRSGPAVHSDQRHRGGCAGWSDHLHSGANHILTCASNCLQ